MTEFRVVWQQCPYNNYPEMVLFVEATDEETARAVAKDYIERNYRVGWFTVHICEPYVRPVGGRVVRVV